MSLSPTDRERVEAWGAEFEGSFAHSTLPEPAKEKAGALAAEFLAYAGAHGDVAPEDVGEEDLRESLLEHMPEIELPMAAREAIPEVAATFLEWLEDGGRVGGGRRLAAFVRALGPAYRERLAVGGGKREVPIVRAAPKVGRNDPCPCGSGRKFKKCCGT